MKPLALQLSLHISALAAAVSSSVPSSPSTPSSTSKSFPVLVPRANTSSSGPPQCVGVFIIGAREPTSPPGLGSTYGVANIIQEYFPDSTIEPLDYPALGEDDYHRSVTAGLRALLNRTAEVTTACPETKLILIGYSQGAQIIDNAICGGPDPPSLISDMVPMPPEIGDKIAATIWLGNPRFRSDLPYSVGTAQHGGFAARPAGFKCEKYADRIQSYCDAGDPYCSNGDNDKTHQNYAVAYGTQALEFVRSKLGSANGNGSGNGNGSEGDGSGDSSGADSAGASFRCSGRVLLTFAGFCSLVLLS